MTVNGIMAIILCYFTEIGSFALRTNYIKVVKDRPILTVTKM